MTTSSAASPMPPSSATAAFELPAMPGAYEDFEFSLNLPENITASDFNLVATPEFSSLFGLPVSSFGEISAPASAMTNIRSSGGSGGLFTPTLTPSATTHWKLSAPSTPRGTEAMEDLVMSHPPAPLSQPQPTSMPLSAMTMPTAPPPQPTGAPLFTFEQLAAATSGQQLPDNVITRSGAGLFDASETNFLTNFLSGFDGWDFNPNLPIDLPSFADAEKSAMAMGSPTVYTDSAARRNNNRGRASGGGASNGGNGNAGTRNRGSPYGAAYASHTSPGRAGMESSVSAAFGLPTMYDWHGDDESAAAAAHSRQSSGATGKKIKTEHGSVDGMRHFTSPPKKQAQQPQQPEEPEKRSNHMLSEQRRRNHIREAFKELVDLLEAGRDYGARGLGLSSGSGTGIEDEGLDDRSDYESTLEDEEPSAATKRRKLKARRRAALEAARKAGATGHAAAAAFINGGGRGKGRGRGGSAGGGAGSKSAVLFQAVDLLHWLDGRNNVLTKHIETLEDAVAQQS